MKISSLYEACCVRDRRRRSIEDAGPRLMSTQPITDEPVSCCRCRVRVQDLVPTTDDIVSGCRSEQATALMPVLILDSSSRARPQRLRAGPSAVEPGRKQIPSHASNTPLTLQQHRAAQPCTYFCLEAHAALILCVSTFGSTSKFHPRLRLESPRRRRRRSEPKALPLSAAIPSSFRLLFSQIRICERLKACAVLAQSSFAMRCSRASEHV